MSRQFIANIDKRNIDRLHSGADHLGMDVELGKEMLFTLNGQHEHFFHPVFCRSTDEGVKLMKKYIRLAVDSKEEISLKTDSIPPRYWSNTHVPQGGFCF